MNDLRISPREPVSTGPGMLTVLVTFSIVAYGLRLFAVPMDPPPGALSMQALQDGEWWSILTYIFTHKDLWHLLSNMILLVLAGRAVERNFGSRHLLYIFLAGAWGGAALSLCFHPATALIGASAGVWGVIGAFIALHPEYDLMRPFRRIVPLRLKAKRLFPAFMTVHVGLEIAVQVAPGAGWMPIAHLAHAGGLLAGWLYGRRLAEEFPPRDEWNDFFPLGLRRRFREGHHGGAPVTAGHAPRQKEHELPALPAPPRELSDSEFLRERVDPVLEKLYANGPDKLTPEERAVLEEASRRFSRNGG